MVQCTKPSTSVLLFSPLSSFTPLSIVKSNYIQVSPIEFHWIAIYIYVYIYICIYIYIFKKNMIAACNPIALRLNVLLYPDETLSRMFNITRWMGPQTLDFLPLASSICPPWTIALICLDPKISWQTYRKPILVLKTVIFKGPHFFRHFLLQV